MGGVATVIHRNRFHGTNLDPIPANLGTGYAIGGTGGFVGIFADMLWIRGGDSGGYSAVSAFMSWLPAMSDFELLINYAVHDPITEQYVLFQGRDSLHVLTGAIENRVYAEPAPASSVTYMGRNLNGSDSSSGFGYSYGGGADEWMRWRVYRDQVFMSQWAGGVENEPSAWQYSATGETVWRNGGFHLINFGGGAAMNRNLFIKEWSVYDLTGQVTRRRRP